MEETGVPRYNPYHIEWAATVRVAAIGLITGLVGWLLYVAISQFFVVPVFCNNPNSFGACASGGTIGWVSAHVIVLAVATIALARLAVYRPLLIVLAVFASTWGAHSWLGVLPWWQGTLAGGLLMAFGFALFGLIARLSSFAIAAAISVVIVILARLVLLAA